MDGIRIFQGPPADTALLSPAEGRCYAFLARLGISYLRAEHPDAMDYGVRREIERAVSAPACKNLFLRDKEGAHYYLLMVPSVGRMDGAALSAQLGLPHLHFAGDDELMRLLGVRPGAVSALALVNPGAAGVELLAEERVLAGPKFLAHPCVSTTTLAMATASFLNVFLPALGRPAPRTVRFD